MLIFTCMTCPIFRTIRIKREKKVGKMSRLLRCCAYYFAFVLVLTFGSNAFAAGYTCPTYKKYTSCNANYYVSNCGSSSNWTGQTIASSALTTGNSCISCPDGYTCQSTAGLVCPKKSTVTCSAGYYLSAAGACTLCEAGYKCNGQTTYTPNGSIQGRTACSGTAEYQNATGQTTCKAVSDGYYKNGNTAQQACGTGYFCKSGVRTACTTYGTGYTTGTTTASVNTQCYLSVAAGKVRSGTTGTTLSTCAAGTYKAAHNAYYGTTYTCSACTGRTQYSAAGAGACSTVGSGYYTTGCNTSNNNCTGQSQCTSGTWCASGVANNCSSLTGVSVSGGTYSSAAGSTANTACKYTAPSKSITGCASVTTNTVTYSGSAWPATTYSVSASGGYIIANNNTASATCSQCSGAVWSAGGTATSCSSCPTATSGWTRNTGTGWSAVTQCNQTKTGTAISSYCSAGVLKQNATSTTAWGTTTIATALQAAAGSYVNGQTCTQCTGRTYSAGGTVTSCSACLTAESGWTAAGGGNGQTSYTTCKETKTGSAISSYCSAGVLTKTQSSATAWGSASITTALQAAAGSIVSGQTCTQCGAGKYSAGGTATSCGTCANWTYSAAGASSCTSCPAVETGYAKSDTTSTGWTTYTKCIEVATAAPANCSAGKLQKTAASSTTWGSAAVNTALSANAGYYVNGTACSACGGNNYYCTGGTAARATVSSGYYSTGGTSTTRTGQSQCTSGTYCASGVQNQCPTADSGWTKASPAGSTAYTACYEYQTPANCASGSVKRAASSTTAYSSTIALNSTLKSNAGYYASTTATSCTICPAGSSCAAGATAPSTCANWTYSSAGASSCTSCPTLTSGWSKQNSTGTGWTSVSSCVQVSGTPSNCASGNLKQTATSSTAWGSSAVNTALSANAGYYVNGTACTQCQAGYYCTGGTAARAACSALTGVSPTGGTYTSAAGSSAKTACKYTAPAKTITGCATVTPNQVTYSGTAWPASTYNVTANAGYVIAGNGTASATCNACTSGGYSAGGTATSCGSCPAAETGWTMSTATGLSAVTACTETTTPATSGSPIATICTAGTLTKKATSTTAWGSATASGLTAKAGRYVNGTTCSACAAGTYTSAATTATSCTAAAKGYYVSGTEQTAQSACAAGTYTSSTGQSKCTDAAAGTYTTGCQITASNTACTGTSVCATNTWSNAKASSCTACTTAKGYGNSGTTAASHAGIASCKVTCGGGKYVATAGAGCVDVGIGYWGAGGTVAENATLARNQCASGLTTIGTGAGADEAADCGRVLNFNGQKIYLRSEKRTTPSLNISINGTTFYGNMTEGTSKGSLRINSGGTVYSVHDDSM